LDHRPPWPGVHVGRGGEVWRGGSADPVREGEEGGGRSCGDTSTKSGEEELGKGGLRRLLRE
jgi:hypothetical protein